MREALRVVCAHFEQHSALAGHGVNFLDLRQFFEVEQLTRHCQACVVHMDKSQQWSADVGAAGALDGYGYRDGPHVRDSPGSRSRNLPRPAWPRRRAAQSHPMRRWRFDWHAHTARGVGSYGVAFLLPLLRWTYAQTAIGARQPAGRTRLV
jgi:hypothetical protein